MASPLRRLNRILRRDHPGFEVRSVRVLGEGLDHVAFEVNGSLVVRVAKGRTTEIPKEARLLGTLGTALADCIPAVDPEIAGTGYFSYGKLPGVPLQQVIDDLDEAGLPRVEDFLARFLSILHSWNLDEVRDLVPDDAEPLDRVLEEAAKLFHRGKHLIPEPFPGRIRSFLLGPAPEDRGFPCLVHNDLGIEHLLFDMETRSVSGVIDWSDAAAGDPAADFGKICRDLGPNSLRKVLTRYQPRREVREQLAARALFYARCSVFEEIDYGRTAGQERYLSRALKALDWLFPAEEAPTRS